MVKCQKCENEIDNFHVCCYCREIYCLKHINFKKHTCSKYYFFSTHLAQRKSKIIQWKSVRARAHSHLVNCFNTTDVGIIYVEPQSDAIVALQIGEKYWNRKRSLNIEYDDTISSILITWEEKEIRSYTSLRARALLVGVN